VKPPKSLKIGPYTYRVTTKKADLDRQGVRDQGSNAGYSQVSSQVIAVRTTTAAGDEKVGRDYAASTLLHEVLHQCLAVAGFRMDSEAEENVILAMETPLLQTLRDNPELLAYLTS
jgi:hypothetical protein